MKKYDLSIVEIDCILLNKKIADQNES